MLELDKNLVEEYGISPRHEPSLDEKREFVAEQVSQIQKMAWRVRVDMMVMNSSEPHNDDEQEEKDTKLKNFRKELSKYIEALTSFNKILDELEA